MSSAERHPECAHGADAAPYVLGALEDSERFREHLAFLNEHGYTTLTVSEYVDMLRFDLDNENETIRNYRERVQQAESLGEYALAEHIRAILVQEQEHQINLATALGKDVIDVTKPSERG